MDPKRRLQDLAQRCDELSQRLEAGISRYFEVRKQRIHLMNAQLTSPEEMILRRHQHIDILKTKLEAHWLRILEVKRACWARLGTTLDAVSPLKVLERGYSITRKGEELIKSSDQLQTGDTVKLAFARGTAEAKIEKVLRS